MKKNTEDRNNRKSKPRSSSSSKGFTLVELMVSLSLFTVVIVAAIGSLYSVNDASRRIESMRSLLDNLNFAVESMSRTIRTADNIGCGSTTPEVDCPFGGSGSGAINLYKTIGTDETVVYQWVVVSGRGEIQRCISGTCLTITAPGVDIERLSFFVEGASSSDSLQPKVIMFIEGIATAGTNIAPFIIQTQVSVRTFE